MDISSVSTVLNDPFLLRYVLLQANYNTVLEYCRSYFQAQSVCKDNVFWIQKAQKDFGISPDEFRDTASSPVLRYVEFLTQNGGVAIGSENFIPLYEFVK